MFEKEIERGVEWLNQNHPDWLSKIDLDNLIMSKAQYCILGQVVGSYFNSSLGQSFGVLDRYGFSCEYRYDDLQKEWTNKILQLREEKSSVVKYTEGFIRRQKDLGHLHIDEDNYMTFCPSDNLNKYHGFELRALASYIDEYNFG